MTPEAAEALANAFDEFSEEIRKTVTQDDFKELKEIVADLGLAQKRTEQRLDSLTVKVEELAEAQIRTEQRLDSLTVKVEELAEAQIRTEKTMQEGFANVNRRFDVLGSRWGDEAEEAFRQGLLEHVRHLGYTVEHYQGQDPEGFINGTPRSFDLDVLVQNGTTIASEIKSQASGADVTEFARSVTLLERQTGRKVNRKILVAVVIRRHAHERARDLGVVVATGFEGL
jgi:hypothetical protein